MINVVCAGIRLLSGNKLAIVYLETDNLEKDYWFPCTSKDQRYIGMTCTIEQTTDTGYKFDRSNAKCWKVQADLVKWHSLQKQALHAQKVDKLRAKISPEVLQPLDKFKYIYQKSTVAEKHALMGFIEEYFNS